MSSQIKRKIPNTKKNNGFAYNGFGLGAECILDASNASIPINLR